MKLKDISIVHLVIREEGDSFWLEENNDLLFDEIVKMLNKRGYDLVLVVKNNRDRKE